jgi:hypothetical protein
MKMILILVSLLFVTNNLNAQYWIGDHWYDNPLGFEPIKLHTSMGFILPALVVGTGLILTEKDSTLKNKISIFNESGFSWGYKYPNTFLSQNNTGINVQLRKWMSIGVEFDLYFAKDQFNSTNGIAIRPFARFYPVNNDKWRLYFESGGGFVYFFDYFPKPTDKDERLGTLVNGTTKYGIGSEINFSEFTSILFGIRHLHVSNGNTKGVERNPSHDSNGFFVGFSHKL